MRRIPLRKVVERLERRRLVNIDEAVEQFRQPAVDVVPPPLVIRYVVHADEALGARGAERVHDARVVTWHPQIEDLRPVRNRHRHAIEEASRRWRGGRREDSAQF